MLRGHVGQQSDARVQHHAQALRRHQGAPGADHGDRPLGRLRRAVQDLDPEVRRRRDAAGLFDVPAGGRAGQAAGLLQGHQQVARGRQEAARAGRLEGPEVQAAQSQHCRALYAGRRLLDRPVAPDRRDRRA